jgi:uncharacterized protein (DUF1499 family)
MMLAVIIIALLLLVVGIYLLLEKPAPYGAWYGLARLTGSRPDIDRVNWATLTRHKTPNDALACPATLCPNAQPDFEPGIYPIEPVALLTLLKEIGRAEPDTGELSCEPDCDRIARFLQRTRVLRFPDTIDIEVFPAPGGSTLAIYSRSLIGRRDFGVNRARITRWLAALEHRARGPSAVKPVPDRSAR